AWSIVHDTSQCTVSYRWDGAGSGRILLGSETVVTSPPHVRFVFTSMPTAGCSNGYRYPDRVYVESEQLAVWFAILGDPGFAIVNRLNMSLPFPATPSYRQRVIARQLGIPTLEESVQPGPQIIGDRTDADVIVQNTARGQFPRAARSLEDDQHYAVYGLKEDSQFLICSVISDEKVWHVVGPGVKDRPS